MGQNNNNLVLYYDKNITQNKLQNDELKVVLKKFFRSINDDHNMSVKLRVFGTHTIAHKFKNIAEGSGITERTLHFLHIFQHENIP